MANMFELDDEYYIAKKRKAQEELEKQRAAQQDSPWLGALAGLASGLSKTNDFGRSIMEARNEPIRKRISALEKEISGADEGLLELAKYRRDLNQKKLDRDDARMYDQQKIKEEREYQALQKEKDRAFQRELKDIQKLPVENEFKRLPVENQEVIKDLSKKNASKISIANQIEASIADWDNLTDDQKVARGRSLLKTLNSTEGADAIGAEEAKRLGSKLEFALGNLFNSNPIQFGRDLEGFKEQAIGTLESVRRGVRANQREIERMYGKPVQSTPSPSQPLSEKERARLQELRAKRAQAAAAR